MSATFFAQPELAVDALAGGDIDIASGGVRAFWAADSGGADLVMLMAHSENGYVLAAPTAVQACADLDDRALASSSRGSLPAALSDAFLRQCPEARPRLLAMPHSGDRLSALALHAVDAAVLQRADLVRLQSRAPGEFHALPSFAATQDRLTLEGVFTTRTFLREHRPVVIDYLRERVRANRLALDEPARLLAEAVKWPALGPLEEDVVASEVAAPAWDRDGGLTPDRVDRTLAFFVDAGSLPDSLKARSIADLSALAEALDILEAESLEPTGPTREDR